jgi:hypothetical protein
MAEPRPGFPLLIVILALLACATPTPERLLDRTCGEGQCETSGSARETSGLTSDSVGFELGPGPGSVTIDVAVPDGDLSRSLELLLKGSGSVVVTVSPACTGCSSGAIELHDEWRWEAAAVTIPNQRFTVVIETLDDTSHAKLLDLRVW